MLQLDPKTEPSNVDTDRAEKNHLICLCRPHISLCGRYHPDPHPAPGHGVMLGECADCHQVWKTQPCVCGCLRSNCYRCQYFLEADMPDR